MAGGSRKRRIHPHQSARHAQSRCPVRKAICPPTRPERFSTRRFAAADLRPHRAIASQTTTLHTGRDWLLRLPLAENALDSARMRCGQRAGTADMAVGVSTAGSASP
jgi:hypothetical protein